MTSHQPMAAFVEPVELPISADVACLWEHRGYAPAEAESATPRNATPRLLLNAQLFHQFGPLFWETHPCFRIPRCELAHTNTSNRSCLRFCHIVILMVNHRPYSKLRNDASARLSQPHAAPDWPPEIFQRTFTHHCDVSHLFDLKRTLHARCISAADISSFHRLTIFLCSHPQRGNSAPLALPLTVTTTPCPRFASSRIQTDENPHCPPVHLDAWLPSRHILVRSWLFDLLAHRIVRIQSSTLCQTVLRLCKLLLKPACPVRKLFTVQFASRTA